MEIIAAFRLFFEKETPDESVSHLLGQHLTRFLAWNDQVSNRLLDHLLRCIPFLPVQDVVSAVLDASSPNPSQQQAFVDCLVALFSSAAANPQRMEAVWGLVTCKQSNQLVLRALEKWGSNSAGDNEIIAGMVWKSLETKSLSIELLVPCFMFCFCFYCVGISVCFKPLSQSIFSLIESFPHREFDESELLPLQLTEHFRVEWLDVSSQPISLPIPRFFASSEQTSQQLDELFAAFPSHLQKLFRLAICQQSEASLRLFADLFTRVSWNLAQLVLDFLLLLQHSLLAPTRSVKLFPATFVVHRTVFYCIQRILILHGKQLASNELLGFTFRHAFVALRGYTEKTEKAVQNPLISEKSDEKDANAEELTATQLAHVTTSAAHVVAFCICLEIQHVQPAWKEKVVDLHAHKSDSFLPEICSVLAKYCDYSEIITEKKERNRYYLASLLQCVTLVLQSIDVQYSLYVFKTFYPHLILILSYEKDNLLVSLSLTVRFPFPCHA